jgi:hypothetical protein
VFSARRTKGIDWSIITGGDAADLGTAAGRASCCSSGNSCRAFMRAGIKA